ncbi:hypothetical protein D9756_001062 [Leucocoprinus leucothites]|uniref:Uncharacterized protein n=1 Tax=Leucocoprinus leucothites TaxID=201217 RepID=A0A8H5GFX4_9AGAR|nr:hypothetical protein D9756_001062 [Leucoagaricus leucothites]
MTIIPLPRSIAVTFTGAFAFGLYFATLLVCLRWLLIADDGWRLKPKIRWNILFITFLIFACNVVYLSMTVRGVVEKAQHFITVGPGVPYNGGPQWESIVSCTMANSNVLLADMVLIYRVWVIYERQYVFIIFPLFFWLAGFVCTVLQIYLQIAHLSNPNIGPYAWATVEMSFGPGIVLLPFWISTVLLNAYSSMMLIRRIYQAAEETKHSGSVKHLHLAIRIVAESGLLYFSITFAHLLVWFGKEEFAVSMISVLNAPIIGVAFNWFLIRFEKSKAEAAAREANVPDMSAMQFTRSTNARQDKTTIDTSSTDTALVFIAPEAEKLAAQEKEKSLA